MAIKVPGKRFGKRLAKSKVFGEGGHGHKAIYADLLITPLVDTFVIIVLFLIANFSATGDERRGTTDPRVDHDTVDLGLQRGTRGSSRHRVLGTPAS